MSDYTGYNMPPGFSAEEAQNAAWETPQQQNKMALVDFIGFIVLMAYVFGVCI